MNIKYLYIVILLAINGSTFSQSKGIIVYRILTEKLEIQDNEALIAADFYKTMNSIGRVQDSLRFNLEFNEYESIFYLDKKSNFGLSNEMGYNSLLKKHGSIFYRNEESKSLIEQVNSDGYYLVHYKIGDIEWELSKENKIINGYRCFKAVSRIKDKSALKGEIIKQIEAWFCTELGISLGPKYFGGLPGLILELKEGRYTYYVESIDLNVDNIKIEKPTKGKVISREEYLNEMPVFDKANIKQYIGG